MTVAENMALVMGFPRRFGLIDWAATKRQAQKALEDIGIQLDPDDRVFDLFPHRKIPAGDCPRGGS
jgi:ribose transport system ATP-binding protein